MRDFTLKAYERYIVAIQKSIGHFFRFDEFLSAKEMPEAFCLLKHDVDRKPGRALKMARLENKMGVKATYYFRAKRCSYNVPVIKEIASLGHEIGYHYESLSDTNGDIEKAVKDFEKNLAMLRKTVPIKTCAMHGQPLKPFDNRDIWRVKENYDYLKNELGILGEVYWDIDYTDIAYINDTGRNWTSGEDNLKDKVVSGINGGFSSGEELLKYLLNKPHDKICFQVHPERWCNKYFQWLVQLFKDFCINIIKRLLKLIRT